MAISFIKTLAISFFVIAFTHSIAFAQLNKVFEEIQKQKYDAEQKIQPLAAESEEVQKQKMAAQEQLKQTEEKLKQLELKKEAVIAEIQTPMDFSDIVEALAVGKKQQKVGDCEVQMGKEPNELYVTQNSQTLRILFAEKGTPQQPLLRVINKNSQELHEIYQPDYNPKDLNKKSGPMKAEIILAKNTNSNDTSFKIVHAKFRGESIGDGFLRLSSSFNQKGFTCLSLDSETLF